MAPERSSFRIRIAGLLGFILVSGLIFAALHSGSNDAFKLAYTLTFFVLVYGTIAARYRDAFWHGFAIAGVAYFLIGFGPWINTPTRLNPPHGAVNRSLATSVILEFLPAIMTAMDGPPPFRNPRPINPAATMKYELRLANRAGIGHCVLTLLFALGGGSVSRALARRPRG